MESINTSSEPVLDGAKIVAAITGLAGAICTVLVLIGWLTADKVPAVLGAATTGATALVTLLAMGLTLWQARKVRAVVTPSIDPRTVDGVPLIPAGDDTAPGAVTVIPSPMPAEADGV